ncbi:MAG: carbon-nitrogen hydrolase family protein [Gammaproteobacteria bacterium]|nr:carbon-nitrogen hydrolase family protein [Gammaproteobacteria bacterium]NNM19833.1 carbon-nitrogen hydrolase family protein [Gammaproteobacteria bacterium]
MTNRVTVAAVQMVSSDVVMENLATAGEFITLAAQGGAGLVVLPENFAFMGASDADRLAIAEPDAMVPDEAAPLQAFLAEQARVNSVYLAGGTIPVASGDAGRVYSACFFYAPDGSRLARYDKVHLFDVDVPGGKGHYRESASTVPGNDAVVVGTPFGRIGLATCYDLRFPELLRIMAGPEFVAAGSAFTTATGAAHWETLVRARAVENLTCVVAASQGGRHSAGRETWGHSMIVDAWGNVLAQQATGAGMIIAQIDLAAQQQLRAAFPALTHRRPGIGLIEV